MSLAYAVHRAVVSIDQVLSDWQLRCWEARDGLITLFFHGLFLDEAEIARGVCEPQQGITLRQFRQVIEYFLAAGFRFVSPPDLLRGLPAGERFVLLTFDDGYFNNSRALPLLEEFGIAATFFVAPDFVSQGKAYWPDVLYRAGLAAGRDVREIREESRALVRVRTDDIEQLLVKRFGADALQPVGEVDRPFTPAELREFARKAPVFIGNHTRNHAVLGAYDEESARAQIAGAQALLEEMTGQRPLAIAYPTGEYSRRDVELARAAGLKLGFTAEPRKERLPRALQGDRALTLGRFCPWGDSPIAPQCRYFRSDLMLHTRYQRWKNAGKRAWRSLRGK